MNKVDQPPQHPLQPDYHLLPAKTLTYVHRSPAVTKNMVSLRMDGCNVVNDLFLIIRLPASPDDVHLWVADTIVDVSLLIGGCTIDRATGETWALEIWRRGSPFALQETSQGSEIIVPFPFFFASGKAPLPLASVCRHNVDVRVTFKESALASLTSMYVLSKEDVYAEPTTSAMAQHMSLWIRHHIEGNQWSRTITSDGPQRTHTLNFFWHGHVEDVLLSVRQKGSVKHAEPLDQLRLILGEEHTLVCLTGTFCRKVVPREHYGVSASDLPFYIVPLGQGEKGPALCNGSVNFSRIERVKLHWLQGISICLLTPAEWRVYDSRTDLCKVER